MEQRDHGTIFFSEMMKIFYGLFKESQDIPFIESMIQKYDTMMKNGEKQLNKEAMMERKNKGKANKSGCELFRYEIMPEAEVKRIKKEKLSYVDGTIKMEDQKLHKYHKDSEKWKEMSDEIVSGTMALVGREIYVWDQGSQTWSLSEMIPKYDRIEYLCTFKNTDLQELDLETLDCVYRKDYGCHSKVYTRFQDRLTFVSEAYNNFVSLKSYIDSDQYMAYFENQIQDSVKKYYVEGKDEDEEDNKKKKEENEVVEEIEKPTYDQLDILIHKIFGLKDYDMRLNYIYTFIDKDGLLIGKDLYSKKYMRKIDPSYICGHYVYKNRERKASTQERKSAIVNEMVDIFGDQGEASGDVQTCTHCGEVLTKFKDDDVEGYTENGQQIRSRDVWTADEDEEIPQTMAELESYQESGETLDCESKEFRKIFLDKDFTSDDLQKAKAICTFVQKNLAAKIGVTLRKDDLISIIIDSLQKIRNILPFKEYSSREAKKLIETKGYSLEMIQRMITEKKFDKMHTMYELAQRNAIMASRFLITIQTAIPDYKYSAKLSPCPFISFEGLDGIQFMACLLIEMGSIKSEREQNRNETTMEASMNYISDMYNEFKKNTSINLLYLKKREYKMELSKKIASFNTSLMEDASIVYEEAAPLPENFAQELLNGKNIEKNYKLWKHRINYLNQELKKIYMQVYNEAQLRDVNPESSVGISMIEKACCDEYLDDYMGFIFYVEDKSGNVSFSSMIQEVRDLYKLRYLFHMRGTYHRAITDGPITDSYYPLNLPVYIDPEHTSEEMIVEKFATYVDEGPYMGTLRLYVGSGKDKKDTKSGKLYDEIVSKKYTVADYKALLNAIALRKSQELDFYTYSIYNLEELTTMKMGVDTLKDKEIQKLIASLSSILGKSSDKTFMEKYQNILANIGYYQYYMALSDKEKKQLSDKQMYRNNSKLTYIRLQYVKKCYNDYLRKYLAMIKNGKSRIQELQKLEDESLLPFEDNQFIAREVQEFIYKAYESIEQFYDPTVRSYFSRAKLRNDAKTIQSIHGEDYVYDAKHKSILKQSSFSFKDASEIVHYLFVKELNDLILCNKGDGDDEEEIDEDAGEGENLTMNAAAMSEQCKYRAIFILFILDKIASDNEMIDDCTLDIERIKNAKHYSHLEDVQKALESAESNNGGAYFARQLQYTLYGRIQSTGIPEEGADEEMSDTQIAQQESLEMFTEKAKADYIAEHGMEMPADMLESMKEDYMDKLYNAELAEQENENVQDGEGEYGGVEVDGDFTADEMAFVAGQE